MPVLCLAADPIVFRTSPGFPLAFGAEPLYGRWRMPAYLLFGVEIAALASYLFIPPRSARLNMVAATVFSLGALVALLAGVLLAPYALMGLLLLIGVLGFVPWLTAVVLARTARHAARLAHGVPPSRGWAIVLLGACVVLGPPTAAAILGRASMSNALSAFSNGSPARVEAARSSLRRWRWLIYPDDLVHAWESRKDPGVRLRIAAAYRDVTGQDLSSRLEELRRTD